MTDIGALRTLAQAGDPRAQTALAYALLSDRGGPQALGEAVALLKAAVAGGGLDAHFLLAALIIMGLGMPRKLEEAQSLIQRAASLGDETARAQLAALGDLAAWRAPIDLQRQADAPRVFAAQNFLPRSACDWLIQRARPELKPSVVYDAESGGWQTHPARTSETANFRTLEHDLIMHLASWRIASALGLPVLHQEGTKVLRYVQGQEYRPHYDFVRPGAEAEAFGTELSTHGQRVATALVYLNDDYEGGQTAFPRLGLQFRGKTGDALFFWNLSEAGALERDSLHAGLPVTLGEKWLLSKWVRQKPLALF